jgi:hypothetical protein
MGQSLTARQTEVEADVGNTVQLAPKPFIGGQPVRAFNEAKVLEGPVPHARAPQECGPLTLPTTLCDTLSLIIRLRASGDDCA